MAREVLEDNLRCLVLSKSEAVEVISLLSAQLANDWKGLHVQTGAVPSVGVFDRGVLQHRVALIVEGQK